MRDALRGIVIGVLVLGLLGALASRAGWIETDLPRAAGQGAWNLSRATGLTAFAAIALDVIVGLMVSTRSGERWLTRAVVVDLHGWLSPLSLALVAAHALVLVADGYIRFDLIDVGVPFAASWRPFAVGLGVIAAYLAIVVHASFALRKRIGPKTWRKLHYLSFVIYVAATAHALLAGTDSAHPAVLALYALPAVVVAALLTRRVGDRSSRPSRA